MRLKVGASNPKVTQVATWGGKAHQNPVHHPLESAACIAKVKIHLQELEEAERSDDGRLLSVLQPHWDLSVTLPEVDLAEDSAAVNPLMTITFSFDRFCSNSHRMLIMVHNNTW
jgi:hypothetical protein